MNSSKLLQVDLMFHLLQNTATKHTTVQLTQLPSAEYSTVM